MTIGKRGLVLSSFSKKNLGGWAIIRFVIAVVVVGVLSAAVVYVLNVSELFRQARDSDRLAQISNLGRAINDVGAEQSLGNTKKVYISVADPDASPGERTGCGGLFSHGLLPTSLPSGWKYECVSGENLRKIDGTGWIPMNFSSGTSISELPIDPVNTVESGYYYSYASDGRYALASALMESQKYLKGKAANDRGTDPARYETGTNIDLWAEVSGLRGYWKFDEGGNGAIAGDSSGAGNNGQVQSPAAFVAGGKVWGAIQFPAGGSVDVGDRVSLHSPDRISMAAWVNPVTAGGAIYGNLNPHVVSPSPQAEYSFELADDGTDLLFFANPGDYNVPTVRLSGPPIPLSQWTYVAVTWDGYNVRYYRNGSLVDTKQYTLLRPSALSSSRTVSPTNFPYRIGVRNYKAGDDNGMKRQFNGTIDELRVYARTLTGAEIAALYNATK